MSFTPSKVKNQFSTRFHAKKGLLAQAWALVSTSPKARFLIALSFAFIVLSLRVVFPAFWLSLLNENSREAIETIVSIAGTIATIAGGLILFLNFTLTQKNTEIAQKRFEAERKKVESESALAQSRLVSERFSRATEQLGNNSNISIRQGGIYSLEQIAKESDEYHWVVMEILTAFLREQPSLDRENYCEENNEPISEAIKLIFRADLQAALTVIGRRDVTLDPEESKLNLIGANLFGASFIKGNFVEAKMLGANLSKTHLGDAKFLGTTLKKASFHKAVLRDTIFWKADLRDADLTDTYCRHASFAEADIQGANFQGAEHLSPSSIMAAKNWEKALYDDQFKDLLNASD